MKIKIYSPFAKPGIGDYTDSLFEELSKIDKDIRIILNNNSLTSNPFYFIKAALKSDCDLLHVQFNTDLFGKIGKINGIYIHLYYLLSKLIASTIITTIHDVPDLGKYSWLNKICMKSLYFPAILFSRKIIVHTEEAKTRLLAYGINSKKIIIIPIGIDTNVKILNNRICKKKIKLVRNTVLFVWGFVRASKCYEDVINILPNLKENIVLLIAGPVRKEWQNYYHSLRTLAKKLGVEERVIFENRMIPETEVPFYFGAADLILFPYSEITQSAALSQAFAYLTPCLTSDISSFRQIKQQFNCIETYTFKDKKEFIFKINNILNNKNIQQALIRNTKKLLEKTNWTQIAKQTHQAYQKIIFSYK